MATVEHSPARRHSPAPQAGPISPPQTGPLSPALQARVETLQVVVKEETPFLPKVAFTLITLASVAGATFTGLGLGLAGGPLAARWFTLWSLALAGGFLVWRVIYLRDHEADVEPTTLEALNTDYLARAARVARVVAVLVVLGSVGPLVSDYLAGTRPTLAYGLAAASVLVGLLLVVGHSRTVAAVTGLIVALAFIGWGIADAGAGVDGLIRIVHFFAFSLWLGGALWNIAVAMPVGRKHPHVGAVLAGAHQLDRFRWVVRFALPTIIVTGLIMAGAYRALPQEWWLTFPGVLIPLKVMAIVALVVVFITCPLFRQCSPVQGVCNVDDLGAARAPDREHPDAD